MNDKILRKNRIILLIILAILVIVVFNKHIDSFSDDEQHNYNASTVFNQLDFYTALEKSDNNNLSTELITSSETNDFPYINLTDAIPTPVATETDVIANESNIPTEYMINISGLSQDKIPTGCESVSTVMILNYYNIDITPEIFIDNFLPKSSLYRVGNKLYGPSPEEYFVGNPYTRHSLGCYPPVIDTAVNNLKNSNYPNSSNISTEVLKNIELTYICSEYICNDTPILIWLTIDMKLPTDGMSYFLEDNTQYIWKAGEHCIVLCGYDEAYYYFNDPLQQGQPVKYPKEQVAEVYNKMGNNALAIIKQ